MQQLPFELKVYIYRRPHMRSEALEFELGMGRSALENMFDDEVVNQKETSLYFSFPERWLNIVEERSLYQRIQRFYPNVKQVVIRTQSVYIIQSTPSGCCHIVQAPEEQQPGFKLQQEAATGRLWNTMTGNVLNEKGLTVL